QMAGYLAGEYPYDEAVRRLKRDTRHFAKRQLTWFRKEPGVQWVTIEERDTFEAVTGRLVEFVHRFLDGLAGAAATERRRKAVAILG
ncbi:MAG: hypothetical protein KGI53_14420, partial [Nitrospirota bacterium]|nr:hypothetical protein [Nitrospirota bacterium]